MCVRLAGLETHPTSYPSNWLRSTKDCVIRDKCDFTQADREQVNAWLARNDGTQCCSGFRRTRTQRSGTQSAAADGTRTRWLFELRRCRSLIEAVQSTMPARRVACHTVQTID
jgi:hypothetical protein